MAASKKCVSLLGQKGMRFLFKFSAQGSAFTAEASENALSPSQTSFTAIYSPRPSASDCKLVNVKINLDMHFAELGPCRLLSSWFIDPGHSGD